MHINTAAVVEKWVWHTPDFEWHSLIDLDETDDFFVYTGWNGVSIDAHNLITNL